MKAIAAWFAKNPVAANLLMAFLMIGGAATAFKVMKVELFPEFSLDMVSVSVVYPGAAPEEIEESIVVPIEEEVHSIEGVKRVMSTAIEGSGSVIIEAQAGEDVRRLLDDIKTRVDAIDSFPEQAEKPVIEERLMRSQVVNVAIYGDAGEKTLKRIGEDVRDEITMIKGISQVELVSTREYRISIEVSEHYLRKHGLTFSQVANAVRNSSIDLSGGSIKTEAGEILLRTKGKAYVAEDFDRIVLMTRPDGTRILLHEVANVIDGFEDTDQQSRFNGKPAVMVQVFRIGDESALGVSASVVEYVRQKRESVPAGISLETWQDGAIYLKGRMDLLTWNGLQGLALVFLVLALFLKFRLSFWVTLGIPISFLGAILVMPAMGQSLNMLSLFAFILVLGIVVDDAIVVGESIYKEHEQNEAGVLSAVRGVTNVAVPVIFAVLTTIVAFLPMALMPGLTGKFFAVIPLTVIPALAFSLVESQWILPAHLSHESTFLSRMALVPPFKWWTILQRRVAGGLELVRLRIYKPLLSLAIDWRYVTLAVGVATLCATVGLVGGGFVKFVYFPEIEGDVVAVQVTMPQGTSVDITERAVDRIEAAALELREEMTEVDKDGNEFAVITNMMASIGDQPYMSQKKGWEGQGGVIGPQFGEVTIELVPAENRVTTAEDVVSRWRELTGPIAGAVEVNFDSSLMSAGKPIDVQFSGRDVEELRSASEEFKTALAGYNGVFDITDSFRGGKEEYVFDIKPAAESLGLTRSDLAVQVRQGFYGEEAQRIQRGRDEVKVMVHYPERDRRSLHGIEDMRIRTPGGGEVPFYAVAEARSRRGYATINRTHRQRTINVTADIDNNVANANEILGEMQENVVPGILARHVGVGFSLEGQSSDQAQTFESLKLNFTLALLVIFGLMAIPFRSYLQPLIVMSAIPFGLVGAILGHVIMGVDVSMLSMLGIAALSGVVVNDSLVMVDFVNRERDTGLDPADAARSAGIVRFRPIILTSLTTFAGLLPLILEKSVQAQFLVPMAVSLAFGVLFATFISLLLVPTGYVALSDFQKLGKRAVQWITGSEKQAVPAPEQS